MISNGFKVKTGGIRKTFVRLQSQTTITSHPFWFQSLCFPIQIAGVLLQRQTRSCTIADVCAYVRAETEIMEKIGGI